MRLTHLAARGFRNLGPFAMEVPPEGVTLLGRNAQGKTNLLEAMYYPVLFRSVRGVSDPELVAFGEAGFRVEAGVVNGERRCDLAAVFTGTPRRKRIVVDGTDAPRRTEAVGRWLAVAFIPGDVALASGAAAERRRYLDRMLALAETNYLRALMRYRGALAQRNAALRQGRPELARAFDAPLAQSGAEVVRERLRWTEGAAEGCVAAFEELGEAAPVQVRYRGNADLADAAAWPVVLQQTQARDSARGTTSVGPHRDDLELRVGGRPLRTFGSTGQQRSAAVALKLLELDTLRAARQCEPALLLDDVFAELDRDRQRRLAGRLLRDTRQVVVTAPRRDELPPDLALPTWELEGGAIRCP